MLMGDSCTSRGCLGGEGVLGIERLLEQKKECISYKYSTHAWVEDSEIIFELSRKEGYV